MSRERSATAPGSEWAFPGSERMAPDTSSAQMAVVFLSNPPDRSHASPTQTCFPLLPRGGKRIESRDFH